MEKHPINEFNESTVQKIREMIDVNTVVGTPITTPDGIMVIPVSKVSMGFLSGGSDWSKDAAKGSTFGCGAGTGITIQPVGFLTVKDGSVKFINVTQPAGNTLDRVVDMVPDVIDKVSEWRGKDK